MSSNALSSGGFEFTLLLGVDTPLHMTARLGEGGPIMDDARVHSVYGANGSYWRTLSICLDGSRMVEVRLQLGNVPPDIEVRIHIFKGGVTFDDGTIDRILTAADFAENGVVTYRMIQSLDSWGSVCHTTGIYQNGEYLGD